MASATQKINWRVLLWAYAPFLLWVGVIFFLSSDSGSSVQTSRFVRPLLHFLFPAAGEATIDLYHWYIRKAAHFTEYGILAMLVARTFLLLHPALSIWPLISIAIVALVASMDEFNQSFNPHRTSSPYDALLDVCGGTFAVLVLWLIVRWRRGRSASKPAEEAPA